MSVALVTTTFRSRELQGLVSLEPTHGLRGAQLVEIADIERMKVIVSSSSELDNRTAENTQSDEKAEAGGTVLDDTGESEVPLIRYSNLNRLAVAGGKQPDCTPACTASCSEHISESS